METKFHNLAYVLQNEEGSYNMVYGQRCEHYVRRVFSPCCKWQEHGPSIHPISALWFADPL